MAKVLCPNHKDTTPSMEVYEDGAYCFVCNYSTNQIKDFNAPKKPKEDLHGSIERIKLLPTREIRGLQLHYDSEGYYVLWPDLSFYKKRLLRGSVRYLAPTGYSPPLFQIASNKTKILVLVEGELNALSLATCTLSDVTIASPGAATNFSSYLSIYLQYTEIFVIIDRDVAGVIAGLKIKEQLLKHGKRVHLVPKETDYNQTLQDKGVDGLKEEVYRDLGL